MVKNLISKLSIQIIYVLYIIIGTLVIAGNFVVSNKYFSVINFISTIPILIFIIYKGIRAYYKSNIKIKLWMLIAICLIVKISIVILHRVEPEIDFRTFYDTAKNINTYEFIPNSRYIAIFPHLFGYAFFLSIIMKVFGEGIIVATIANAILSTISMILIYYICKNTISEKAAVIGSTIWILFPSQTIYNTLILSEPLYTAMLLSVILLIIFINKNYRKKEIIILGFVLGILIGITDSIRPVGSIAFIALGIWYFFVDRKIDIKIKGLIYTLAIIGIIITSFSIEKYITYRLGEEPSSFPGFNVYVGLNEETGGKWSEEDSNLLHQYGIDLESANEVQKKMLENAKERITEGNINFPTLLAKKLGSLWYDDSEAVYYSFKGENILINNVCNLFYYIIFIFSIFGAYICKRKNENSEMFIICIFMIGLTLAHMITEVSGRYHYSGIITLINLGVYGLEVIGNKVRG